MRRYIAVLSMVCGLFTVATTAHAGPISACSLDAGTGQLTCDLYEADALGNPAETGTVSSLPSGFDAGWLVGYSFLLDAADPTVKDNVSDVLIIHSSEIDIFSKGAGSLFDDAYSQALAGDAIDGTPISSGQVLGDTGAGPGGANRQFDPGSGAIGLFYELTDPVVGLSFNGSGFFDIINIHSDADFGGTVPEPASLTLLGLGGAIAAYRRRRSKV